jgi:hypothetical protein
MPSDSTLDSPPTSDWWATAADRQEAARQAYRQSIVDGQPLSGVQLGTIFDRSSRWGVDRIAEVRSENHDRSTGNGAHPTVSPSGSNGNSLAATPDPNGDTPLPIGSNGNSPAGPGPGRHPRRRNGSGTADQVVPIRSAGSGSPLPIGSNGNGSHPGESAEATPRQQPHAAQAVATEPGRSVHPQPERRSRLLLDTAITLVVTAVAAAASYGHMLHVALMAGEPMWIARAFPVTVDGLVLAALRRGEDGRGWLALGAAVSVAANVLAQFPELAATAGPVVSAWPPLALYGTHRLLAGRQPRLDGTMPGQETAR